MRGIRDPTTGLVTDHLAPVHPTQHIADGGVSVSLGGGFCLVVGAIDGRVFAVEDLGVVLGELRIVPVVAVPAAVGRDVLGTIECVRILTERPVKADAGDDVLPVGRGVHLTIGDVVLVHVIDPAARRTV